MSKQVIEIHSLGAAISFLKAILKIIPTDIEGCKFEISESETIVNVLNSNKTIRAYFKTSVINSQEPITFCFQNIAALIKSLSLIQSVEEKEFAEINFNGNFLTYNDSVSWKLKTVKESVIENWITTPIKAALNPVYSFTTTSDKIKIILGCSHLVNENIKVYLSCNDKGQVNAILDNKESEFSNSVGLPISIDEVDGVVEPICLFLDNFSMLNLINSNSIKICFTKEKVVRVIIEDEELSVVMVMATIKG